MDTALASIGTVAATVAVGSSSGVLAGSGNGDAGGASGATDSSFIFAAICARGEDEDPREESDSASITG